MITDEQFTKLPRYAQYEITRLRQNNESFRAKLEAGPEDSDTFVDSFTLERPLGQGERIKFILSRRADGRAADYISARLTEDGFVLVSGNSGIVVEPRASNVIEIRPAL